MIEAGEASLLFEDKGCKKIVDFMKSVDYKDVAFKIAGVGACFTALKLINVVGRLPIFAEKAGAVFSIQVVGSREVKGRMTKVVGSGQTQREVKIRSIKVVNLHRGQSR